MIQRRFIGLAPLSASDQFTPIYGSRNCAETHSAGIENGQELRYARETGAISRGIASSEVTPTSTPSISSFGCDLLLRRAHKRIHDGPAFVVRPWLQKRMMWIPVGRFFRGGEKCEFSVIPTVF